MRKFFSLPSIASEKKLFLLFGIEGIFYQFIFSLNHFSNNLYATNLGATDTQIGLIQTVINLAAILLLLPVGIIGDRLRSSRTLPTALLLFMSVMYFFYGSVPKMGKSQMGFYFLFLGLTAGTHVLYQAQWQNFFGNAAPAEKQNAVYTFRNRFMFFTGTLVPLICGALMTTRPDREGKLAVLQVFYYLGGILLLLEALVVHRIPCPAKCEKPAPFRPKDLVTAVSDSAKTPAFRRFFLVILVFYLTWYLDWSVWYLEQVQYIGMSEAQMSYFRALNSILQLFAIGFFAKLNGKKSVRFSLILAEAALVFCPFAAIAAVLAPVPARPWTFIILALFGNVPQCCIELCIVQLLLSTVPNSNRSLIISLYTIVSTLAKALMPLLGVQLYLILGGDRTGVICFDLIVAAVRILTLLLLIWYYQNGKKEKRLSPVE